MYLGCYNQREEGGGSLLGRSIFQGGVRTLEDSMITDVFRTLEMEPCANLFQSIQPLTTFGKHSIPYKVFESVDVPLVNLKKNLLCYYLFHKKSGLEYLQISFTLKFNFI